MSPSPVTIPKLSVFKAVAKSIGIEGIEPFTDYFEATSREEAIEQWKEQAVACGVELSAIELVSMTEVQ